MKKTLYGENIRKAIRLGWESLYFSANETVFAEYQDGCSKMVLTTEGDVRILNLKTREIRVGEQPEFDIDEIVESQYVSERYDILENNWYSVQFYLDDTLVDELVMEATPRDPVELLDFLDDFWAYFNHEKAA